MTHYTLATSPFGNFAVQRREVDPDSREIESYLLTPIGNLDALPFKTLGELGLYLDQDALAAEAHRQLAARGTEAARYLTPRPEYVVNRAIYTDDLQVTLWRGHAGTDGTDYWTADTGRFGQGITDSAQKKLAAWWESVRDSIVTPEFLARDAVDRAEYALTQTFRKVQETRDAANAARIAHEAASLAHNAAVNALVAL